MNREPVPVPMLTSLLVDAISEQNRIDGKRPKAFDTMFRHSDAGDCARQVGFKSLGYEETEPMDQASEWVTWLGKIIHDHWQQAAIAKYGPNVQIEAKVSLPEGCGDGDLSSGHSDAHFIITIEDMP